MTQHRSVRQRKHKDFSIKVTGTTDAHTGDMEGYITTYRNVSNSAFLCTSRWNDTLNAVGKIVGGTAGLVGHFSDPGSALTLTNRSSTMPADLLTLLLRESAQINGVPLSALKTTGIRCLSS